jgi:hypothetical protein
MLDIRANAAGILLILKALLGIRGLGVFRPQVAADRVAGDAELPPDFPQRDLVTKVAAFYTFAGGALRDGPVAFYANRWRRPREY